MKKNMIEKLFGNSEATYYRWKKEKRPIIELIEKYFNEEEIEEFIERGTISRYDGYNKLIENKNILVLLEELKFDTGNSTINYENFFADFAFYLHKSIYSKDYDFHISAKNYTYYYILTSTYIAQDIKIFVLTKNNIKSEDAITLLSSVTNDCKDILETITIMKKEKILKVLNNFVFVILYLKYKNSFMLEQRTQYSGYSQIKYDYFEHLCNYYNIKKDYDEDGFESFKKQEIIDGAYSFSEKIKNNEKCK